MDIEKLQEENKKLREVISFLQKQRNEDKFWGRTSYYFKDTRMASFEWDFVQDKIKWSKNTAEIFGENYNVIGGNKADLLKIIYPDDIDIVRSILFDSKPENDNFGECNVEFRMFTSEGELLTLNARGEIVFSETGELLYLDAILIDVTKLKEKEKKLREKEEFFRVLTQYTPNEIYWKDKNSIFQGGNNAFAKAVGLPIDSILNSNSETLAKENAFIAHLESIDKQVLKYQKAKVLFKEEHKYINGSKRWSLTSKIPLFKDGTIDGVLGISTDITKIKEINEEIKRSKLQYQSLFNNLPIAVLSFDLTGIRDFIDILKRRGVTNLRDYFQNNTADYWKCVNTIKIEDANHSAVVLYGANSRNDLIENFVKGIIKQNSNGMILSVFEVVAQRRIEYSKELKLGTLNDSNKYAFVKLSFDYSHEDKLTAIQTVINLDSEAKVKEAFFESQERFKAIYETSGEAMGIISLEGIMLDVNKGACSFLATTKENLIGKSFRDYIDTKEIEDSKRVVGIVIENKQPMLTERRFIKTTGEKIWALATLSPIFDKNKEVQCIIVQLQDITGIKNIEAELRQGKGMYRDLTKKIELKNIELQEALEKAERSEELKNEFLQNLSHEIRTPINAVVGFSNLVQMEGIEEEQRNQYLETIKKSSENLLELIEEIVEMSTIATNNVELHYNEFDINSLLLELYDKYKFQAEYKKLSVQILDNTSYVNCTIESDRQNLGKVLEKLIDNAIKYTPKGSVKLGYEIVADSISVFVEDTGVGISEINKEEMLKPFTQADRGRSKKIYGLGLGLTFANEMTQMLNGKILIDSEPMKGSRFTISLPNVVKCKEVRENKPNLKTPVNEIVVFDNDEQNIVYLSKALKHMAIDFSLHIFKNKNETIELLKQNACKIILINIDSIHEDLYPFIEQVKNIVPNITVVIQTQDKNNEQLNKLQNIITNCESIPIDLSKLNNIIGNCR